MINYTDSTAYKISKEFDRLKVSTNQSTFSGLSCGCISSITSRALWHGEISDPVCVYTATEGATYYDGTKLLEFLKGLESASLERYDTNIWLLIEPFKI